MLFTSMLQFWPLLVTHAKEAFRVVEKIEDLLLVPTDSSEIDDYARLALNLSDKNEICENSEKLLMSEDVCKAKRIVNENCEIKSISLRNCVARKEELRCDYVEIIEGKSYGIVGEKASKFLEVILGEIDCDSGEIILNGSLSYAGKNPWIFSGCIRDNIIFTEIFDSERYLQVLKICAIDKEIETLPTGDDTFIDSACINDSFKARINLARCIYRNADIYLVDECFKTIRDDKMGWSIFRGLRSFLEVIMSDFSGVCTKIMSIKKLFFKSAFYYNFLNLKNCKNNFKNFKFKCDIIHEKLPKLQKILKKLKTSFLVPPAQNPTYRYKSHRFFARARDHRHQHGLRTHNGNL
jgi:hypothetical protein